ncbi:hypothetical protein VE03_00722 [Pseudogymnoascus sp. 23342-1-I1]|nr:hypothetical protein VE03_00722 [Pseudogymnoascus sp. 23342-1-I1]
MPVQHAFQPRRTPLRPTPRRLIHLTLGTLLILLLLLLLPRHSTPLPALPPALRPFRPSAHAPPIQPNSTSGDARWHQSWDWRRPFSSAITLDEHRSVLPPLGERTPMYTYFDGEGGGGREVGEVLNQVLLTWRRAWWAQGFRPVILGREEARRSKLFEGGKGELGEEVLRWLAWESMGGGILCSYLALPMGAFEDPLISYLRRGEFANLTRFDGLSNGLYVGPKAGVAAAIKAALAAPEISKAKEISDVVPKETFQVDEFPSSIAYYAMDVVKTKYPKIAEELPISTSKGMRLLNKLINSHLHNNWRTLFSDGIAVLKPIRTHMTAIVEPAVQLAEYLAQCPSSPIMSSCPPNNKNCKPCVAAAPMRISTPPIFRNNSKLYTIGVVPHPWTTTSADAFTTAIDVPFIRRRSNRDHWLTLATKEILGTGVSTSPRLVKFKEAVASPYGAAHSVWFTAEKDYPDDIDWHFGFLVPRHGANDGKSQTPVPGPERRPADPARDPLDGVLPSARDLKKERELLEYAKLMGTTPEQQRLIRAVEAWNLGDVEAWRFVRAFMARRSVERSGWEEEERKVTGGKGSEMVERG